MKKLMLATVSAAAISLAGIGAGFAQAPTNPNAAMPAPKMQATPGGQQSGTQADQGMPASQGMSGQQGAQAQPQAQQESRAGAASADLSQNRVKGVQEQLKSAGIYTGRIDGKMGRKTEQALRRFQRKNHLEATGKLDEQTIGALQNGATQSGTTQSGSSGVTPGAGAQPQAGATDQGTGDQGMGDQGATANGTAQPGATMHQPPMNNGASPTQH